MTIGPFAATPVPVLSNNGTATVASGTNPSVSVPHGLTATPGLVLVTPTSVWQGGTSYYLSAIGATSFTINVVGTVSGNVTFNWMARVGVPEVE